jgi:chromosome partitioning protein
VIIVVLNRKGGVGKSLVALHLAAAFHERGDRTVLVDLDDANRTALDFAAGNNLQYLVTDPQSWDAEHGRQQWDRVVVDGFARGDDFRLVEVADRIIIPTLPDSASLRVLARMLEEMTGRYRVLLNGVPPRPSREGERARLSLAAGGVPLFKTEIPRSAVYSGAVRSREIAWRLPRGQRERDRFKVLVREILDEQA